MQAVLGRIQLTRMADWTAQRTANAMAYHAALSGHDDVLHLPLPGAGYTHAFYRHYIYVRPDALADGWDRDRIVAEMQAAGIPVMHGTCSEVYLEKAFDGTPWRPAQRLPNARQMGENSIMFMVQPTIDTQTAERYAALAAEVVARAKR
jgi:dTDP-4-amino-4,6-dideoxygalactose transaminase